jgi:hypothetical protein
MTDWLLLSFKLIRYFVLLRATHKDYEEVYMYVFYKLGYALCVETSSALKVGYPAKIKCHRYRQIQTVTSS